MRKEQSENCKYCKEKMNGYAYSTCINCLYKIKHGKIRRKKTITNPLKEPF